MYTKKQQISGLKQGDLVDDIFVVKVKKGVSKYANGFRFQLILSDNTGKSLDYVYWGASDELKVKDLYDSIKPDAVVRVQGKVDFFSGKLQLATNEPYKIEVLAPGDYDTGEFIKPARIDLDALYDELLEYADKVQDPGLKKLLKKVFEDPSIKERFKKHPGSIQIHHNWQGGLLEHTMEVLGYCMLSCQFFELDKDLLIAGALLHDLGKLEELEVTSRIKGSEKGQLVGHLTMSAIAVSKLMEGIDMDSIAESKLLHLMVSHHGKLEYGSPKEPMFPEAVALHHADAMSAELGEISTFIEDTDKEEDFSYWRRKQRNIFLK